MIYLDNGATSFHKPPAVYRAVESKVGGEIVVELEPLSNFYTAEEYHQDYLDKNPAGYCHLPYYLFEYARKANE